MLLLWGNSRRVFGNIWKLHYPAATRPILIVGLIIVAEGSWSIPMLPKTRREVPQRSNVGAVYDIFLFLFIYFFYKLNRSAKWEEAVDSNFSSSWDMRSCEYWCRWGNIWVLKMRIVPANTKPLFCRMTYSHTQDSHPVRWAGPTNTCTWVSDQRLTTMNKQ